jgi:hypothetical protein
MVGKNKENPNSQRSLIRMALHSAGIPETEAWIKQVASAFDGASDEAWRNPKLLKNVAILQLAFGLRRKDIRPLLGGIGLAPSTLGRALEAREAEISLLATLYGNAAPCFGELKEILSSGMPLDAVDLASLMRPATFGKSRTETPAGGPLQLLRFIEDIRKSDGFQEGTPESVCRVVEHYIQLGALKVADTLLEQALEQAPDHPGLWFQKSRLLMALSAQEGRSALHYGLMGAEADALSAAEAHWEMMASEHAGRSSDLRGQVFATCLKALALLPETSRYEAEARRWSADFGSLRKLRLDVLSLVVQEAGWRCDPYYSMDSVLYDRVQARLGRAPKAWQPQHGWVEDPVELARLAGHPLFSEANDRLIVQAYRELMAPHGLHRENTIQLRYLALNFIRLLAPAAYPTEVKAFVMDLRNHHATTACSFFVGLDGFQSDFGTGRGTVLRQHLDAIMSRDEQRDLVQELFAKQMAWVTSLRDDALRSNFDDEVRLQYACGDQLGAYDTACKAEAAGLYRRGDGHGALVLRRTAQRAAQTARGSGDAELADRIARQHLMDEAMATKAEEHFESYYADDDAPVSPLLYRE